MKRGDRINTTEFPADYPLVILSIVGDKIAIGSPLWPKGASRPLNPQQITTVNGAIINL
jgi:hypothetical protein